MSVAAVLLGAAVGGAGSTLVPAMVKAVPEPEPVLDQATELVSVPDVADASEATPGATAEVVAEATAEAGPKVLYAELGTRPGLWWRGALVGALAGAVVGATQGMSWSLLVLLPLIPVMVALGYIDWNTRLLPTWLIKPTYGLVAVLVVGAASLSGEPGAIWRSALGWLTLGAFYFVLWFVNSGGLGYGDVRLSGVLGIAIGYVGWPELLTGAWCGFLAGGVIGGVLAALKVVDRRGVPFGPFMMIGVLMGLAVGPWVASALA